MPRELRYSVSGEVRSIPKHVESYELEEFIGNGQFGDVFRARYVPLEEPRALKICRNPQVQLAAFHTEAQRLCRLKNLSDTGIVRIDAFGLPSLAFPFAWYAMEFIEGKTLHEMMQDGSIHTWGFGAKSQCFQNMLTTIARASQVGVRHYDLHAGNIKLAGYLEALTPKVNSGKDCTEI